MRTLLLGLVLVLGLGVGTRAVRAAPRSAPQLICNTTTTITLTDAYGDFCSAGPSGSVAISVSGTEVTAQWYKPTFPGAKFLVMATGGGSGSSDASGVSCLANTPGSSAFATSYTGGYGQQICNISNGG